MVTHLASGARSVEVLFGGTEVLLGGSLETGRVNGVSADTRLFRVAWLLEPGRVDGSADSVEVVGLVPGSVLTLSHVNLRVLVVRAASEVNVNLRVVLSSVGKVDFDVSAGVFVVVVVFMFGSVVIKREESQSNKI